MSNHPAIISTTLESVATWIIAARPTHADIVATLAALVRDCGGAVVLSECAMRKTLLAYCNAQPSRLVAAQRLAMPLTTLNALAQGHQSIPDSAAVALGYQRQIIYRKKG